MVTSKFFDVLLGFISEIDLIKVLPFLWGFALEKQERVTSSKEQTNPHEPVWD
jgi:hypothetical protein